MQSTAEEYLADGFRGLTVSQTDAATASQEAETESRQEGRNSETKSDNSDRAAAAPRYIPNNFIKHTFQPFQPTKQTNHENFSSLFFRNYSRLTNCVLLINEQTSSNRLLGQWRKNGFQKIL